MWKVISTEIDTQFSRGMLLLLLLLQQHKKGKICHKHERTFLGDEKVTHNLAEMCNMATVRGRCECDNKSPNYIHDLQSALEANSSRFN